MMMFSMENDLSEQRKTGDVWLGACVEACCRKIGLVVPGGIDKS
jgi:hypothetical protein